MFTQLILKLIRTETLCMTDDNNNFINIRILILIIINKNKRTIYKKNC